MTNIIERQGARFIYTNGKKIAKQFNIQKYRHLAKSKAICVTFYIKEARYFMVCDFSWNFCSWNLCTKSMTLSVTWCFIKKGRHFAKRKTICVTFLYSEDPDTLHYAIFIEVLKLAEGRGAFLYAKTIHFALHFCKQKIMHFALHIYIQNPDTLCYIFIAKNNSLCVTFLYLKFTV